VGGASGSYKGPTCDNNDTGECDLCSKPISLHHPVTCQDGDGEMGGGAWGFRACSHVLLPLTPWFSQFRVWTEELLILAVACFTCQHHGRKEVWSGTQATSE
jgi:hypothetical protein